MAVPITKEIRAKVAINSTRAGRARFWKKFESPFGDGGGEVVDVGGLDGRAGVGCTCVARTIVPRTDVINREGVVDLDTNVNCGDCAAAVDGM